MRAGGPWSGRLTARGRLIHTTPTVGLSEVHVEDGEGRLLEDEPRIPTEYLRSLFGDRVDSVLETLKQEMAKKQRGEKSELLDALIVYSWPRDIFPDFPQDPAQAGKWQVPFLAGKLAGYQLFASPETGAKEDRAQPLARVCFGQTVGVHEAGEPDALVGQGQLAQDLAVEHPPHLVGRPRQAVDQAIAHPPREARGGAAAVESKPETVRREEKKVGRNDPCFCGSGKKYKKCHGQ